MDNATGYRIAADIVLAAHVALVVFVVAMVPLVLLGGWRGWHWVRRPLLRWLHLCCIVVVVAQAWLGRVCPLTTWESMLRQRAGDSTYAGSFLAHWLGELLFYEAPGWVFAVLYTAFALLVLATWYWVRPASWLSRR